MGHVVAWKNVNFCLDLQKTISCFAGKIPLLLPFLFYNPGNCVEKRNCGHG